MVRRWLQPAAGLQWLLKVEIGERTAEGRDLGEEIWNFSLSRDGIFPGKGLKVRGEVKRRGERTLIRCLFLSTKTPVNP
ncbi:hypothetical protein LXL04_026701 [Taraxacum kok-saghyz]